MNNNPGVDKDNFLHSREGFTEVLGWLEGPDAAALSHAELEDSLDARGRELLRRMFQDHLSLRAVTERRLERYATPRPVPMARSRPAITGRWRRCSARSR